MIKKYAIFLLLTCIGMGCFAQLRNVNDCLPFMPERKDNLVRTIKQYEPSTVVMGARKLLSTTYYNRQGYEVVDGTEMTFDTLNRLTRRLSLRRVWKEEKQASVWDTEYVQQIEYTPDGVVGYCRTVTYGRWCACDSSVSEYRLVRAMRQTGVGVTLCRYDYSSEEYRDGELSETSHDSCLFQRDFNDNGKLLREVFACGQPDMFDYETIYAYDSKGRKQYEKHYYYGGGDSLVYRYSATGSVIEKSGKAWGEGFEADIFNTFRPDGTPSERTEIWYPAEWNYGENPETRTIIRTWYDNKGSVIRTEDAQSTHPTLEFDIEYWEPSL